MNSEANSLLSVAESSTLKDILYPSFNELARVAIALRDMTKFVDDNAPAVENFDNSPARVIEKVMEPHKVDGLNRYKVKGSENKYWRYSYRLNGRLKHIHVRGGNERTPLVKKRVKTIQSLIDGGTDHAAIAKLLKNW